MSKVFQEHFLDNPVSRLVAILKSINGIFEKQFQGNPFLMDSKSSKNTCEEICSLESCSVSMNQLFEITCEIFFSHFTTPLVIFLIVLNASLLKVTTAMKQ